MKSTAAISVSIIVNTSKYKYHQFSQHPWGNICGLPNNCMHVWKYQQRQ